MNTVTTEDTGPILKTNVLSHMLVEKKTRPTPVILHLSTFRQALLRFYEEKAPSIIIQEPIDESLHKEFGRMFWIIQCKDINQPDLEPLVYVYTDGEVQFQ